MAVLESVFALRTQVLLLDKVLIFWTRVLPGMVLILGAKVFVGMVLILGVRCSCVWHPLLGKGALCRWCTIYFRKFICGIAFGQRSTRGQVSPHWYIYKRIGPTDRAGQRSHWYTMG